KLWKLAILASHATRPLPTLQLHFPHRFGRSRIVVQQALASSTDGRVRTRVVLAMPSRASPELAPAARRRDAQAESLLALAEGNAPARYRAVSSASAASCCLLDLRASTKSRSSH